MSESIQANPEQVAQGYKMVTNFCQKPYNLNSDTNAAIDMEWNSSQSRRSEQYMKQSSNLIQTTYQ